MRQPEAHVRKWSRRSDERPAEILATAVALFVKRGYAATKLEDVAREAGISKGTVYLYFPTKEDLFRAIVCQGLVPMLTRLEETVATHHGRSADLLRLMIGRFGEILESDLGGIPKLVLAEAGNFPEIATFYAEEVVGRALQLLGRILDRGRESGEFRDLDPARLLPVVAGPPLLLLLWKHSIATHATFRFDHRAVFDSHIDILLRGLAPGAAGAPHKPSAHRK